jgi:phage gpG-like protein
MDLTIPEFLGKLAAMVAHEQHAAHAAMDRAATLVQDEAKQEIGTYQGAAGPFVAWAPLADSTLADKERHGYAPPDNPLLRTGEMRDSIERTVEPHEAAIGSDSEIAVYQELGTATIPARSFLGGAGFRMAPHVAHLIGASAVQELIGAHVPSAISLNR